MTLVRSSNICTFKIAERLGKERLHRGFNELGFGKNPENIMQLAPDGTLSDYKKWRPIRFANVSFGQGLSVNGIEIVSAMNTIANGGFKTSPYLISSVKNTDGITIFEHPQAERKRVFSDKTALEGRLMMQAVVEHKRGSGSRAKLNKWTSGGKTGTAEKYDPKIKKAYHPTKRIASWLGFAPVKTPHLVVYVMIDEPGKKPLLRWSMGGSCL